MSGGRIVVAARRSDQLVYIFFEGGVEDGVVMLDTGAASAFVKQLNEAIANARSFASAN